MSIFKAFYFGRDFEFEIKAPQSLALKNLNYFLKRDAYLSGDVRGNEFAFIYKNAIYNINPVSSFIFSGTVSGDDYSSVLSIKARLSKPLGYLMLVIGIIIPIMYLFNIGNAKKDFFINNNDVILNFIFNLFVIPCLIYFILLFSYLMKINDVKVVLRRFKKELEK